LPSYLTTIILGTGIVPITSVGY